MTAATLRADARTAWTRRALADARIELEPASSDASARSYWRTRGSTPSWIVMDSPPAREDPRPWLAVGARLAAAGLHVPAVRAHDLAQGFLLIEDLGPTLYLDALDAADADALYADAQHALLRMQTAVAADGLPEYDRAFLRGELELMPTWFLDRHLGRALGADDGRLLDAAFTWLVAAIDEQPRCFVHRDFHSRNLLVVAPVPGAPRWHAPGIIDFQGAMRGPLTYDLASLLRDCYIAWDRARVEAWAEAYRRRLLDTPWRAEVADAARFMRWFDLTGLQRHVKVLGIFCRLCYRDGKAGYLADLPRVLGYVLDVAARYPELGALADLVARAAAARDLRSPAAACAAR